MAEDTVLQDQDWDFKDVETDYLTHNFHSYPAKFIPQIPRRIIEAYSKEGEIILDPFCGCGGALVEAKLLGRHSIGVDTNPLACLITKVKVTPISDSSLNTLDKLLLKIQREINAVYGQTVLSDAEIHPYKIPAFYNVDKWFQKHVQKELAVIKKNIDEIGDKNLRDFCLVAFSNIINRVSNMESETRYSCVVKKIEPMYPFILFTNKLKDMTRKMTEFNKYAKDVRAKVYCADARKLAFIKDNTIDLIITSPPYIYAWDYTLIHRFRLFWLGYNREEIISLQRSEIGSHLRLERMQKAANNRNVAIEDYLSDMAISVGEMSRVSREGAKCCIVIGSSRVEGQRVGVSQVLENIAEKSGFKLKSHFVRTIEPKRKATNVSFATIQKEHILVFEKT